MRKNFINFLINSSLALLFTCFLFSFSSISNPNNNFCEYMCENVRKHNINNNKTPIAMLTPEESYNDKWTYGRLDETIRSLSGNFQLARNTTNYTFFYNNFSSNETFLRLNDLNIPVSVVTCAKKTAYEKLNIKIEDGSFDSNSFYISTSLKDKIKENNKVTYSCQNVLHEIDVKYADVCNSLINEFIGIDYIIIPPQFAFNIAEYTGHASYTLIFNNSYFQNYRYFIFLEYAKKYCGTGRINLCLYDSLNDAVNKNVGALAKQFDSFVQIDSNKSVPIIISVLFDFFLIFVIIFFKFNKVFCCLLDIFISIVLYFGISVFLYNICLSSFPFWSSTAVNFVIVATIILVAETLFFVLVNRIKGNKQEMHYIEI